MIHTYKILNEIDKIDSTIFFELSAVTRGHSQKIVKKTRQIGKLTVSFQPDSCERLKLFKSSPDWTNFGIQSNIICHEHYVNKLYMYQSRPE